MYNFRPKLEEGTLKGEKFTLSSGYNRSNSAFVRVKDGYPVSADPIELKLDNGGYAPFHVYGEGYLYLQFPGWLFATTKAGFRGWSKYLMSYEVGKVVMTIFNPFEQKRVIISSDHGYDIDLTLYEDGEKVSRPKVNLGKWSLKEFGVVNVTGHPFKGVKFLLSLLRDRGNKFKFHFNGRSYNDTLTMEYNLGAITEKQFCLEEITLKGLTELPIREAYISQHGRIFFEWTNKGYFEGYRKASNGTLDLWKMNDIAVIHDDTYKISPEQWDKMKEICTPLKGVFKITKK